MFKKIFLIFLILSIVGCSSTTTPSNEEGPIVLPVEIKEGKFNPTEFMIVEGFSVRWTNMDTVEHTVTSNIFNSGIIEPNQTWSYTFNEIGTFEYHCTQHPNMKAKVEVVKKE